MRCKLTGKEGSGVDAHIIPRAFYRLEGDQPPGLKVLSSTLGTYPRRSQIGEYDNLIVTEHGERLFSPYDDYAKELLIDGREAFHELRHENRIVGFGVDGYDYARLKLFILSVLWRASVSSRAFFNKINFS